MHISANSASTSPLVPRRCPRCEYNLFGLPPDSNCPECGWNPSRAALDAAAPADTPRRRVARCHLAGLLLLLVSLVYGLDVVLIENTSHGVGGNLPLINVPGPKFWAVGTLRRVTGNYVSSYGLRGMQALLLSVAAVWLLTVPKIGEKRGWLRPVTRYVALLGGGIAFGLAMGTTAIWSGSLTWGRLLTIVLMVEVPVTLLLWLRLRDLAERAGPVSLRRTFDVLAGVVPVLMAMAGAILIWRQYYAPALSGARDYFDQGVATALMLYGAAALTAGVVATVCVIRLTLALLPVALPSTMLGARGLLAHGQKMMRRVPSLARLPGARLRAVLAIALLLVLIIAQFNTFEAVSSYAKRVGLWGNLPLMNYPGLKLNAVPITEYTRDRGHYSYHRWVPREAAGWALVGAAAIAVLTAVRRDVAPRLGRIVGWGTVLGVGGLAGVGLALAEMGGKAAIANPARQAALLIPLVELPLTFLLHLWLARLAEVHGRARAGATLRWVACLVVLLQLGPVVSLVLNKATGTPLHLPDYRNSLPVLAACGAYGALALATAVVSASAVASLLAGLLRTALRQRPPTARRPAPAPCDEAAGVAMA